MIARSLSHLPDDALLRTLESLSSRQRRTTAEMLLHLAEVDRRKLHLRHAYASLTRYCVDALHLSVESGYKLARAARMARRFPAILDSVAEGRLHLSAIVLLAPYLERGAPAELLQAAEHRTKRQLALLLAERFPQPDVPTSVRALPATTTPVELALGSDGPSESPHAPSCATSTSQLEPAPVRMTSPSPQRVAPLSPSRFELRVTLGQSAYDKLCRAKELLSHAVPSGDLAEVLERALDVLVERLEKRVRAATAAPRPRAAKRDTNARHIPADVRRAVWQRDEGRCTFKGPLGERCGSRTALEIDHVVPVALGGEASVDNLRVLCRAHNRYEAERVLGEAFMKGRCEQARARAPREQQAREASDTRAPGHANAHAHIEEVIPCLRALKFTKHEARLGAEMSAHMLEASLGERVKVAIQGLGRPRFERCTHRPVAAG